MHIPCMSPVVLLLLLLPGKNGVISPDQTTFDYVRQRTDEPFEPVYSDAGASYIEDYRYLPAVATTAVESTAVASTAVAVTQPQSLLVVLVYHFCCCLLFGSTHPLLLVCAFVMFASLCLLHAPSFLAACVCFCRVC